MPPACRPQICSLLTSDGRCLSRSLSDTPPRASWLTGVGGGVASSGDASELAAALAARAMREFAVVSSAWGPPESLVVDVESAVLAIVRLRANSDLFLCGCVALGSPGAASDAGASLRRGGAGDVILQRLIAIAPEVWRALTPSLMTDASLTHTPGSASVAVLP